MKKPFYKILYVQVLFAIVAGVLLGVFYPSNAVDMKPLGDGFIKLIKMIIAPVIFCTVVSGIAGMQDVKKIGRVGGKALLYFEVVSTFALAIGLLVANILKPGAGFNADPAHLDAKSIAQYTHAEGMSTVDFVMNIIPKTFVDAFAKGDILQVLLIAILFGFSLSLLGERGRPVTKLIDELSHAIFGMVNIIMKVAPVGAFGAMAFTIGSFGLGALVNLGYLIFTFYLASLLFVLLVLGGIARVFGFSILRFIGYIKDELLIVLGTSSSETVLPRMITKMEALGASKPVVGLVIPTGYSFNLDGTNIYMTLATLFLAQATNTHLTFGQYATVLAVAMLTSKGASGVTGAGFVTLAATLSIIPDIPITSLAIIVGIDKFMSECRALTNLIGNGVATIVISRWEGELDKEQLHKALLHPVDFGEEMERRPLEASFADPKSAA